MLRGSRGGGRVVVEGERDRRDITGKDVGAAVLGLGPGLAEPVRPGPAGRGQRPLAGRHPTRALGEHPAGSLGGRVRVLRSRRRRLRPRRRRVGS
ncbi:hypothetical protein FRIGORI9N_400047 [Frigoribacterium sp. 9N]|nr:hypothetical protein FRIGORI9N_400047 [Frigoribacterium sp. 9N]